LSAASDVKALSSAVVIRALKSASDIFVVLRLFQSVEDLCVMTDLRTLFNALKQLFNALKQPKTEALFKKNKNTINYHLTSFKIK
jgi:hypothetical protein